MVRLFAFVCGVERVRHAYLDPLDDRAGELLSSPDFLYVIDHPDGLIVVDTGVSPDAVSSLGDDITWTESDRVLAKLATIGATRADVRWVVQTHLHYDHAGGLGDLPGVPVVVQEAELAFARRPAVFQRELFHASDFAGPIRWSPVTGEHDLAGDGSILLIPTPGHTPGHQSVLVTLDGGSVLLGGDVHYSREKMRARRLPGVVWNAEQMASSWELVERLERRHAARLILSHELGYRSELRLGPDRWYA